MRLRRISFLSPVNLDPLGVHPRHKLGLRRFRVFSHHGENQVILDALFEFLFGIPGRLAHIEHPFVGCIDSLVAVECTCFLPELLLEVGDRLFLDLLESFLIVHFLVILQSCHGKRYRSYGLVQLLPLSTKKGQMLSKHGCEVEVRFVERLLYGLQGHSARSQKQDMLQSAHVGSIVDSISVLRSRRDEQSDLVVVAERARAYTGKVGQFLGGVCTAI